MTKEQADAKAAALTAVGVPTKIVKAKNRPGGYVTRNVAKVRATRARGYQNNPEKARARAARRYKANPEKARAYIARWQKANPEKVRAYHWRTAGIPFTVAGYDQMLAQQDGVCFLCLLPPTGKKRLFVDHSHAEGHVRGLAHHACNIALAIFDGTGVDVFDWAARAIVLLHCTKPSTSKPCGEEEMPMAKSVAEARKEATAPGPYTPEVVPVDTGNESGGETNWKRSSATPIKK